MTTLVTPIDEFLSAQRELTAVERFARHHDSGERPLLEDRYRALLPASPPGPGQQYRFEVDLASCTGCKSCVTGCHSLNGLDEGETWRWTGTLLGEGPSGATQQTVTTACHHCLDPACLNGCPVDAYEKDPVTGIVRHLDDQCIGCSYCTFTCPYDVPRYNRRLGIVRKCDLCSGRLAAGEAPACVQACPTGAIAIGLVEVAELAAGVGPTSTLVPGAPSSSVTVPTTLYRTPASLPADAVAADHWHEGPSHGHLPLVVMLVLTQLAVGVFALLTVLETLWADELSRPAQQWSSTFALAAGLLAITASVGHLGRPLQAWRAVLGVGHSWLSREIVAFGLFGPLAVAASVARWNAPGSSVSGLLGAGTTVVGVLGVACSVLIYAVTGRRFWRIDRTSRAFAATTAITGLGVVTAALLVAMVASGEVTYPAMVEGLLGAQIGLSLVILGADAALFRSGGDPYLARAGRLMRSPLAGLSTVRFAGGAIGGVLLPGFALALIHDDRSDPVGTAVVAVIAAGMVTVAELAGRHIFFRAQIAPRMPGIPR